MVCDETYFRNLHTHGKQRHSHPHRHDDGHHDHSHPYEVIGLHTHDHDHDEITHDHDHPHDHPAHHVNEHCHFLENLSDEEIRKYFHCELDREKTSEIWYAITHCHDKAHADSHHHKLDRNEGDKSPTTSTDPADSRAVVGSNKNN